MGGRLITAASSASVAVNNLFSAAVRPTPPPAARSRAPSWANELHDPGRGAAGLRRVHGQADDAGRGLENTITFTVRDDTRAPKADILFAVPTATYEAYNDWGGLGKSLYFDSRRRRRHDLRRPRAPSRSPSTGRWPTRAAATASSAPTSTWSSGSRSRATTSPTPTTSRSTRTPAQLLGHQVDMVSGHSEYWSLEQINGYLAARDAGVEHGLLQRATPPTGRSATRTAAAPSSVTRRSQGSGSTGSGDDGANDWGPDGIKGTADDALGLDQNAGTRRRPPRELDHDLPRQRRAPRRPERPAGRPRRAQHAREPAAGATCTTGPSCGRRLPAADPGHQRAGSVLRRPDLAQHRASRPARRRRSAPTCSAGSGTRSRPRRSTWRKQPAGVKPLTNTPVHARPERRLAAGRGPRSTPKRRPRVSAPAARRSSTPPPAARWSSAPAPTTGPTRWPRTRTAGSSRRPTTSSPTWACSP